VKVELAGTSIADQIQGAVTQADRLPLGEPAEIGEDVNGLPPAVADPVQRKQPEPLVIAAGFGQQLAGRLFLSHPGRLAELRPVALQTGGVGGAEGSPERRQREPSAQPQPGMTAGAMQRMLQS
jgi:hypothetical protein